MSPNKFGGDTAIESKSRAALTKTTRRKSGRIETEVTTQDLKNWLKLVARITTQCLTTNKGEYAWLSTAQK